MRALALLSILLISACGGEPARVSYGPIDKIDTKTGYYPRHWVDTSDDNLLIVTMSGGGKRASAFAQGMLDALAAIPHEGGTLLDEVDIVSSVSGGSVTAGNLVANGPDSFAAYKDRFLYIDQMPDVLRQELTDPPIFYSLLVDNDRIEPIVDMLERTVIPPGMTYGDIPKDSPYWFANATDIQVLQTFPFTQYQFDIICSDLLEFPIARAMAASAGVPVATSSVVVQNHAPCPAQRRSHGKLHRDIDYLYKLVSADGLFSGGASYRLERFSIALEKMEACKEDQEYCPRPDFIHLFDGGVTDNLGLSEPLWFLTDANEGWNPIPRWASSRRLKQVNMVTANAASAADSAIGDNEETPAIVPTLLSVINAGIDRRSIGLTAQAATAGDQINGQPVDHPIDYLYSALSFRRIQDPVCRRAFSNIETSWGLKEHEVSATIAMGAAQSFASLAFRAHAGVPEGSAEAARWDQASSCLLKKACDCMADPAGCTRPEIDFPSCR